MADKTKAIYAPGELSRIREKLGVADDKEAKRLAQMLGGEVGIERSESPRPAVSRRRHPAEVSRPGLTRRVETAAEAVETIKKKAPRKTPPEDDPSISLEPGYLDRLRLDKFAGRPEFDIKSPLQVLQARFAFLGKQPDFVSSVFVRRRMPEYYAQIEKLVVTTRNLFPRGNAARNQRLRREAPLAYAILDAIRNWDIERISKDMARIQAHPRTALVSDFVEILRAVYRPLYTLGNLDFETHIRGAYKELYKLLYLEDPVTAREKQQELIRGALIAYRELRREIHYLLYPLLLKTVSPQWVAYERFFIVRKNRYQAFLGLGPEDQIDPERFEGLEVRAQDRAGEEKPGRQAGAAPEKPPVPEAERRAVEKGLKNLEILFPTAGWDRLSAYPDLYPYFVEIFDLTKRGVVNIAPTDPLQQILILMRILEELFFGLRYVNFGAVPGPDGTLERMDDALGEIINNWQFHSERAFDKEYLPRMADYVRLLEGSPEERNSAYCKKLNSELHWIKKLFFLPYYRFESFSPPPVQKRDVAPVYTIVRQLRKNLSAVALGIEQGIKAGGAPAQAPCDGIDNPWEPFQFQIPNPVSTRLNALLSPKSRNNASLVFFCLAVTTVLDFLVNNENSWAYSSHGPLFRSENGEGIIPLAGVDLKVDADGIFRQELKKREEARAQG